MAWFYRDCFNDFLFIFQEALICFTLHSLLKEKEMQGKTFQVYKYV